MAWKVKTTILNLNKGSTMKFVKLPFLFFFLFLFTLNLYATSHPPLFTGEFEFYFYTQNALGVRTLYTGSVSMVLYKVVHYGQDPTDRDYILEYVDSGSWDSSTRWIQARNTLSTNTDTSVAFIFDHVIGGNGEERYCMVIENSRFIYFTSGTTADIDIIMVNEGNGWDYNGTAENRDTEILHFGAFPGISQLTVSNNSLVNTNWSNNSVNVDNVLYSSGTVLNVFTNSVHQITKVEQNEVNSVKQFFTNWNIGNSSNSIIGVQVSSSPFYVIANFELRNKLTIQTSFGVEGTGGGTVNADQIDYSVPTSDLFKERNISVNISIPLQQVKNEVWCNFNNWSTGSTSNSITITMDSSKSITANYTPETARLAPMNARIEGSEGDYVIVNWDEHPDTNVTQYKVWRKLKNGTESVLTTVCRGTTEVTDYSYKIKYGSDATTLFYAVTAYYAPSGVWAPLLYDLTTGEYVSPQAKLASNNLAFTDMVAETPTEYSIGNYPNPFNPTTTINYQLPKDGMVTIKVYDVLGKEVATLVNEAKSAGYYKADFDASKLTSGVYICSIQASGFNKSIKLLLTK